MGLASSPSDVDFSASIVDDDEADELVLLELPFSSSNVIFFPILEPQPLS
jgi:hypothetical protein